MVCKQYLRGLSNSRITRGIEFGEDANEVDELDGARAGGRGGICYGFCDTLFYDGFDLGETTGLRYSLFPFVYLK